MISLKSEKRDTSTNRVYDACIRYVARLGGDAVFARKQAFPLDDNQTTACQTALGGRVATMTITLGSMHGGSLQVASWYVPVEAQRKNENASSGDQP